MDWIDFIGDNLGKIFIGFLLFAFGLMYLEANQPHFVLNKSEWTCTKSHSQLVMIHSANNILIPINQNICDVYERK